MIPISFYKFVLKRLDYVTCSQGTPAGGGSSDDRPRPQKVSASPRPISSTCKHSISFQDPTKTNVSLKYTCSLFFFSSYPPCPLALRWALWAISYEPTSPPGRAPCYLPGHSNPLPSIAESAYVQFSLCRCVLLRYLRPKFSQLLFLPHNLDQMWRNAWLGWLWHLKKTYDMIRRSSNGMGPLAFNGPLGWPFTTLYSAGIAG